MDKSLTLLFLLLPAYRILMVELTGTAPVSSELFTLLHRYIVYIIPHKKLFVHLFFINSYEEEDTIMIEVAAALSAATTAFNAIKKGFEVGRDIESMSGDLSRWMGSVSDINKADEYAKKPPLFKKLFAAGSVEEEAMASFMAKKKAEDMRYQLKQLISLTRGPAAWEELLRTEGEIRKKRQAAIYAQKERQRKVIEWTGIFIGISILGGFIFWLLTLALKAQGLL